ncbi:hypothetical protein BJ165DRAFT_1525819 [Panaeolus papilionaceus]|nr:hypothetical protein BJ165DRAFT_1525819 [Panaeolus papilionaceus]
MQSTCHHTIAVQRLQNIVERALQDQSTITPENSEKRLQKKEIEHLAEVHKLFKQKAENPQSCSNMTLGELSETNICPSGVLRWKTTVSPATVASSEGTDLYSDDRLFKHLHLAKRLFADKISIYHWIYAFFSHISSIIESQSTHMHLYMQQCHPTIPTDERLDTLPGYVLLRTVKERAEPNWHHPENLLSKPLNPNESVLYIADAKVADQCIVHHVPRAIFEMYACVKMIGKTTIRGAVTNGRTWRFLVLTLKEQGRGTFLQSEDVSIQPEIEGDLSKSAASAVSSVLADWVVRSHSAWGVNEAHFVIDDHPVPV